MTDLSIVITAHREGIIAAVTARSARAAMARAAAETGLSCETVVVLDRGDAITAGALRDTLGDLDAVRFLETDEGDPGLARNRGIEAAQGTCATFLDGDDLWSSNWLSEAWRACERRPDAVLHSQCNVVFGGERNVWWHVDSESALYDPLYLSWSNYWDAMSFARTSIYRDVPFRGNDLKAGYGHEDWHWNVQTVRRGIAHKPVEGTIHFKRRRPGSQMAQVVRADATIWTD